jgi:hypothetical protein
MSTDYTIRTRKPAIMTLLKNALRLAALGTFLVLTMGCATSSPYQGEPALSVSYLRHLEHDDPRSPPRVVTIATANVANVTDNQVTVVLDCTESRHTLTIAPKTVEHVLLDPKDLSCEVQP